MRDVRRAHATCGRRHLAPSCRCARCAPARGLRSRRPSSVSLYPCRRPPPPGAGVRAFWLLPDGGVFRVGGDAPLGEKAFSSDPKRVPWGTAPPSRRPSSARVSLASQRGPSAPCGEGPERCSPAYRGPRLPPPSRGRVTHGPGPGIPGAVLPAALLWARVALKTRRAARCGAGRRRLRRLPLLRVERLSARSRPEPRPVGAARAWVGAVSLGGVVPPGCGFPEPRPGGWRERKTDAVGGSPRRREGRAGGLRWRGPGSGQARGRVPEAGRRPGRRGAALVCGGGIPVRFPGGPPASSALPRSPPSRRPRPCTSGAPVLREASSPLLPTRPFASGRLPRPASRRAGVAAVPTLGRTAAPHGGAPLGPDDAGAGGRARVRFGQGVRSAGSAAAAVAGPELPREVRSLAGGDRSQSAPRVPRDRLCCPEGPRR